MNNKFENILTKSAKEELEKYLIEEKERILSKAYEKASNVDDNVKEIALRDILEAKDQKEYLQKHINKSESKRKRIVRLLTMSGVLYSIIGILIYLYQNTKLDIRDNLGLIVTAVGILVTFMAFFYNQLYMLKEKNKIERGEINSYSTESDFSIVERWTVIEKLTREIIEKQSNEKPKSFNQILEYLKNNKSLTEKEHLELRELLILRNKILHESINISKTKRKEYLNLADNLIDKLEKQ
ncbi:hypothetical protein [Polaribacter sp. NJDZ03]|uniref:hypothetical protein n=1 Tax=Polaribacter sp. NJDZ03 TaxID=2855841 RepID=UPI001C4A6C87|nr:hypothetical protein [Polaribacter sp. NJDZ03]